MRKNCEKNNKTKKTGLLQILSIFFTMKYYYEKPKQWVAAGETYICDHPFYKRCTLFRIEDRGLAVVQEHFNAKTKTRWWGSIDPWLAGDIFFHEEFQEYLDENAEVPNANGLYPTVPVRRLMWALRMKPLKKEYWEETL